MIRGSSHAFPTGRWFSVLLISGAAAGTYWVNSPMPQASQQNTLLAAMSMVGLIAVALFFQAAFETRRHFRFRGVQLELTPETAVSGSEFAGTLLVPVPFQAGREFKATLDATEATVVREKEDSYRTQTRPLHSDACNARSEAAGAGTLLRFAFRLPADAQASLGYGESILCTSLTAGRVYVTWHVKLSADLPGIDLDESFEIPVVRPGAAELPLPAGHNPSFTMARAEDGLRITQPAWKKPGNFASAANMLGAGTLTSVIVFGLQTGGFLGGVMFVAGAALAAAIAAYFAHELAVTIGPQELRIVRRIAESTLMDVRLERSRIVAVESVPSFGRYADGVAARTVRVRTTNGETYALAEFMLRTRDVLALCNLVAARLALGPKAILGAGELQRTQAVHVYEQAQAPGVKLAGGLITLAIAGWLVWPWFDAFYEANWGEVKAAKVVTAQPPVPAGSPPPAPSAADATGTRWWPAFEHAIAENSARRFAGAEREFQKILSTIERESGPGHPAAGLLHHHLAMTYGNQGRNDEREASLKRALEIFERQPVKTVKAALGPLGWAIDRESVARELGDLLWDRRRYADALVYYEKAYAAAAELDTTEEMRNERLAQAAAGVMVTSCTQKKWDIAERAMADLKQRYPTVAAGLQPRLKYWIDTGEPRLKARQC